MKFIRRKSQEEKDFERRVRLNEAIIRLDKYIDNSESLLREYEEQAVEAKRLGNELLAKRFAAKMLVLDKQIRKAKSLKLIIKDLALNKERFSSIKNIAEVIKDLSLALSTEGITTELGGEIKKNIRIAMEKARRMDIILSEIVDSITDTLLTVEGIKDKEIRNILEGIESKAAEDEKRIIRERNQTEKKLKSDIDERIEKNLEKIKRMRT